MLIVMKRIIFLALVSLFLTACDSGLEEQKKDEYIAGGMSYYTHYIQTYVDVTSIKPVIDNNDGVILVAEGTEHFGADLCYKYNDVGFNRTMADFITSCVLNHFTKINLVSNKDFDEAHKAGTSLGDIAYFVGGSAKPFIDGKYDKSLNYNWKESPEVYKKIGGVGLWYHYGFSPLYLKLQDITEDSLLLASDTFGISFASLPTLEKEHTFTLTATDCNGKTLQVVFDWEFVS